VVTSQYWALGGDKFKEQIERLDDRGAERKKNVRSNKVVD